MGDIEKRVDPGPILLVLVCLVLVGAMVFAVAVGGHGADPAPPASVTDQAAPPQQPAQTAPTQEAPRKKGGRCWKHKLKLMKPLFCPWCD